MHRAPDASRPGVQPGRALSLRLLALQILALALCASACSRAKEEPGGSLAATIQEPYNIGTELAVVELARPSTSSFVLRATIPLLPHIFPRRDSKDPFSILTPDGTLVPAQTEVVTWFPKQEKGADVVEVIARVNIAPQHMGAARLAYTVVFDPHEAGRITTSEEVETLLASSAPVLIESRDAFGHAYSTDLLAPLRTPGSDFLTLRAGEFLHQTRVHDWLEPVTRVAGSQGTLPHLMGVHGFVTLYDREEFFGLDLRVHNGGSGHDPADPRDDPLGEVFFEDLRIDVPSGWKVMSAVEDPFLGTQTQLGAGRTSTPLVRHLPGDKLHLMPVQAQFQRRLMIHRDDPVVEERARAALREEGLAFVLPARNDAGDELFSWWNPATARYFPQNQRLPELDFLGVHELRVDLENQLQEVEKTLRLGNIGPWPIVNEVMGWCHPWGPSIGYLHGGSEIYMIDGLRTAYAGSRQGYLCHQRMQRMYTCRQSDTLYNADGRETRVEDWLEVDGHGVTYMPVWVFLTPVLFLGDSFGFGNAPTFQQDHVAARGLEPDYAARLREYQPIDIEHMVRYSRSLKTLAWLGNDALAKSDLRMQAELMRLSYDRFPQSPSGQAIVTGMYFDATYVHEHPGLGFNVNRGEGWAVDTVAAAYAMASPEWRQEVYPWFRTLITMFHRGQESCSGVIGSVPNWSWFGSQYRVRQSISAAILHNALWSTMTTVFAGQDAEFRDKAREVLERSCYAMISDDYWDDAHHAPYFLAATGPFDSTLPGFCGPPPSDGHEGWDDYQVWSSFAFGFRLTQDPAFLTRATEMAGGDLRTAVTKHGLGELENRASLLVLLQQEFGL